MTVLTRTADGRDKHEVLVYNPEHEEMETYWVLKGSCTVHICARAEATFYDGMVLRGDDFPVELDIITMMNGVNSYDELKEIVDEHIQDEIDNGLR